MKNAVVALLVATAAFASPAAQAATKPAEPAAPTAADWTHVVTATPEGGFRMGNPNAKVKLVEYFSFTCPHCAAFSGEAFGPLTQKYVSTGQVSFEVRVALRDALDFVTALSTRCAGPRTYFGTVEDVMAAQSQWESKASEWIGAHKDELNGPAKMTAVRTLVTNAGLEAIVAKHGVTPAALTQCLDDKGAEAALQRSTEDAWNVRKINGTPGFLINDTLQPDVFGWAALEPKIQAALKS
ncbi:MAG TPA: thioredoxin domain-containing protein [Sphingomonas sp.]|nr:thioredoxin domain-containing protein [Sphingomonas sp.]